MMRITSGFDGGIHVLCWNWLAVLKHFSFVFKLIYADHHIKMMRLSVLYGLWIDKGFSDDCVLAIWLRYQPLWVIHKEKICFASVYAYILSLGGNVIVALWVNRQLWFCLIVTDWCEIAGDYQSFKPLAIRLVLITKDLDIIYVGPI